MTGAQAFNSKMLIDFLYNNGSSSLFKPSGGDSHPNALYYEKADCALRVHNFGKALVRLTPISQVAKQWTTSKKGQAEIGGLARFSAGFNRSLPGFILGKER